MIKIPKIRLFRYLLLPAQTFIFFLLYGALPIYVSFRFGNSPVKYLAVFYIALIVVCLYSFNRYFKKKYESLLQIQDLQEKINISNAQHAQGASYKIALQQKVERYHSLKNIIEEINKSLSLESTANSLVNIAFSSVANNKGVCNMYLLDQENQVSLSLFKTRKEDKKLVIKAKQGDIFDYWVLRHAAPLIIEDVRKDFRFDQERAATFDNRPVSSLISAPFISDHRFFGILRLDHPSPGFYTQDDLRLLVTICDLGAVALENDELYRKTEDLAIHDGLTSLYAKGYFLDRLREEAKRCLRQAQPLSLLILDIDHFKNYNDKFGHIAGDIVLKTLSSVMSGFLKGSSPIISRFGGEEFCVILAHMEKEQAKKIAEGLRLAVEKTDIILRREKTGITVSIGVASLPDDAADDNELIIKADRAMYVAKQKGRNRVIEA